MTLRKLGYSAQGIDANCDLDTLVVAVGNASGAAAAASAEAAAVSAENDILDDRMDAVELAVINAQASGTQGISDAAAAAADAAAAQATADQAILDAAAAQATADEALELAGGGGGGGASVGYQVFNVKDPLYGAVGDGVTDDTVAIQAASTACNAAGGGNLYFPKGRYLITADVTVTRLVTVIGDGAGVSKIVGNANTRSLNVTGAEANGAHEIRSIGFDTCGIGYGRTSGDFGRACIVHAIEIEGALVGIYYGFNCYLNDIDASFIHDCTTGVLYDLATAVSGSGSNQTIRASKITNCVDAVKVNGNTTDGHHITISGTDLENNSNSGLKTVATGEGMIKLQDVHFELMAGYFIDNAGANIWLDGFWALSVLELAWFKQSSGNIFVRNGRASFTANKFAEITGGNIFVDPGSIFSAARWFSEGVVMVPVGGSTPGFGNAVEILTAGSASPGKVFLFGPSLFRAQTNVTLATMTNAAPGPVTGSLIWKGDANNRVYEFAVNLTSAGSDAILRIDLTNGVDNTARLDLGFPLAPGAGTFRLTYSPGVGAATGQWYITGIFVVTATGVASTYNQSANESAGKYFTNRALTFKSEKLGATASTFTVSQLNETVSGATIVGV